jgi:phosphatidylserine decarboxylase
MINILRRIVIYTAVCVLVFTTCAFAANDISNAAPPVKALKNLYDNNRDFRATMDQALKNMQAPDPATKNLWPGSVSVNPWKGKKFEDVLKFFNDWYYLQPEPNGANDEFNFIEKFAWFYYKNKYARQIVGSEPGLGWCRDFSAARGKFLETKESTVSVPKWTADPSIHMEQYVVPPEGFKTFNDFFIRDLKPGARTVASPKDDSVLVAPTDCVLTMIDPLTPETEIPTKLNQKLNVKELLKGSEYAKYFENGTAISCILLPNTYHHYHAVVSGRVVESREDVAGQYSGIQDFGSFINAGNIGYGSSYSVFENFRRGYFIIETAQYGHVAMIPVGLDTIGSVVFEDKVRKVNPSNPIFVSKGEKLGHFSYGGSLVITLIEQGISSITIPQGQQIGVFKKKKTPASK